MAQNTNVKTSSKLGIAAVSRIDQNKRNRIKRHKEASLKAPHRLRSRAWRRVKTDWDAVNAIRKIRSDEYEKALKAKSALRSAPALLAAILP